MEWGKGDFNAKISREPVQGICLHHRKNELVFICITNPIFRGFVKILKWYIGISLIDMERCCASTELLLHHMNSNSDVCHVIHNSLGRKS